MTRNNTPHTGRSTHHTLDPLEPRTLLTAYTPTTLVDEYAIPPEVLFALAPTVDIPTAGFGAAAAVLGDLDADGADDFAVAAPGATDPAVVNGLVFVYSGRTRAILSIISGDTPGFGAVLGAAGDVNADGRQDLFVGTPDAAKGAIYSAFTGAQLRSYTGDPGSEFGFSFAALDDVDRDGTDDFAIGAPSQTGGGTVFLISGDDGATIRRFDSDQAGARFGHALIVYLDVRPDWPDGEFDGIREIVIGAPLYDSESGGQPITDTGRAWLFNPSDGIGAFINYDPVAHAQVGYSLALAGQAIFVGAPNPTGDPALWAGGWVHKTDGGHLGQPRIMSDEAGAQLGLSLRGAPALDGENVIELLVERAGGTILRYRLDANDYPFSAPTDTVAAHAVVTGDFDGDTLSDTLVLQPPEGAPVVGRSIFSFRPTPPATGFSADGNYVLAAGDATTFPFIATRETFIPLRTIPELASNLRNVRLTAVSNDGMVAGYMDLEPFFIDLAVPHQVNFFDELSLTIDGLQFASRDMRVVAFGPTGDALIKQYDSGSAQAWILSGNTLTHMFEGLPSDQRADGTVLGMLYPGSPDEAVLWTRTGGASPIPALRDVWKFNPDGSLLAVNAASELVIFRDGIFTRVRGPGPLHPIGIDSAGRIFAQRGGDIETSFVDTNGFAYVLVDRITAPADPLDYGLDSVSFRLMEALRADTGPLTVILLLPDGRVLTPTHILTPDDDGPPPPVDAHGRLQGAPGPLAPYVVATTEQNSTFGLTPNADGSWTITPYASIDALHSIASYADPKDGNVYVVAFGPQLFPDGSGASGIVWRQRDDGSLVDPQVILYNDELRPVSRIVVFTATDQRVHVVGVNVYNEVVMFFQTGNVLAGGGYEWSYDNITVNHLAPQGFASPGWNENTILTAYVAPWNGLNVAGLNAAGEIRAIWWAPGQVYWSGANLSLLTGMGPLQSSVTSYVTPWGGLNVAGIDSAGDLQVVWWVPGFESQWRKSNMTQEFDGAKLVTAAAYVNAWGGLNIAGIDSDTGAPTVYWWTPGMIDWISEPIIVDGSGSPAAWAETTPLLPVIRGQEQNLLGTSDDGDVLRLSWNPGDTLWTLENLTALAQ